MTALACDPTMLFMAAALMQVEKKLDDIQQTQQEILSFLQEKERAVLQGDLNVLGEVTENFKYNWDNQTYKNNKHNLVQHIKKDAEANIILYRDQIASQMKKRNFLHSNQGMKEALKKVSQLFKDYQLALYLYAYASFLEVMLLGNFGKGYLDSVEQRIAEYSMQYRTLYTDCYDLMEQYAKTTVESKVLSGLASANKFMGETVAKIPVISDSQLDENLIEGGDRLRNYGKKRAGHAMDGLKQVRMNVTTPFVENIHSINTLYNQPMAYLFDNENLYVQQIPGTI